MSVIETLNDSGEVVNSIIASEAEAERRAPGRWRLAAQQPEAAEPAPEPAPASSTRLTRLQFRNRFTLAEKAAIEFAALDDPSAPTAQRQQAAMLRACLADQAAAEFIDLLDATTIDGVQLLVQAGLLTEERGAEVLIP